MKLRKSKPAQPEALKTTVSTAGQGLSGADERARALHEALILAGS